MATKKATSTSANNKKAGVKKTGAKKVEKKIVGVKEKVVEVEKKAEEFEEKADKEVDILVKKAGFVDRIINASWVNEILNLSFIESANKGVRRSLETICKVFGFLGLLCGVIFSIYSVYMFFKGLVHLFQGNIRLFLLSLILLALSAFILIISRGWLKMKKWLPALSIITILIYLIILVISIFTKKISFGLYLLCVLLSIVVAIFVLKNKDMFRD